MNPTPALLANRKEGRGSLSPGGRARIWGRKVDGWGWEEG